MARTPGFPRSLSLTESPNLAMSRHTLDTRRDCGACAQEKALGFEISIAFQPIVNLPARQVFAQEALVRGIHNESAGSIFAQIRPDQLYRFDQTCRIKAIEWAAYLELDAYLSINFMPQAVYQPETCIRATLEAARRCGFPRERIIFEITEAEEVLDKAHLRRIVDYYRRIGFATALDDFGAGYSGLNLLADFKTDFLKLDLALIRNVDTDPTRQAIIRGVVGICRELGIQPVAEGVETAQELSTLEGLGIELFQGYYLARPGFQSLPQPF